MALTRCPACRARLSGDEPPDEPCRRCGSELALIRTCFQEAERQRTAALAALRVGRRTDALAAALHAVRLVDEPETREVLEEARSAAGLDTPAPARVP